MDKITVMEICGTHTATAVRYGLREMLPENIRLVSGPGCPVCVTPAGVIDKLAELSKDASRRNAVVTFGDLFRVRGTGESLANAKASGGDVRVVYSPFDALDFAEKEPGTDFIIAAVGFETTAPVYAALLERAAEKDLKNVKLFTALKTMPAAVRFICETDSAPDGFIAPGHVCAVTGTDAFSFIAGEYKKPCVAAGFTARGMLEAIKEIARQVENGESVIKNYYPEAVTEGGQAHALALMGKYFEPCDSNWRGIGDIAGSGLKLRKEYNYYEAFPHDASPVYPDDGALSPSAPGCRCRDVMLGKILPAECGLFGKVCTARTPVGACMVTGEGACGIFFANIAVISKNNYYGR